MGVQLNHTIVWCADKVQSATFLAEILGRPEPTQYGPFGVIELDNGVSLDFYETKDKSRLSTTPSSSMTRVLIRCSLASVRVV